MFGATMKALSLVVLLHVTNLGVSGYWLQELDNKGIKLFSKQNITENPGNTTYLSLKNNLLTNNYTLEGLSMYPKLKTLHLGENRIESLGRSLYNCTELKYLYIDNNKITNIQSAFAENSALLQLEMPHNLLTSLNADSFFNLANLIILSLNDNQITTIEVGVFANKDALESLYLHNNKLAVILKHTFDKTPNLKMLFLNDNLIFKVEDNAFRFMKKLNVLWLNDNKIETYNCIISCTEAKESDSNHLKHLDLRNNRLSQIPYGILTSMKSNGVVKLPNNKITSLSKAIADYIIKEHITLRLKGNDICICPDVLNSQSSYEKNMNIRHSCTANHTVYMYLETYKRYKYPEYLQNCKKCNLC